MENLRRILRRFYFCSPENFILFSDVMCFNKIAGDFFVLRCNVLNKISGEQKLYSSQNGASASRIYLKRTLNSRMAY